MLRYRHAARRCRRRLAVRRCCPAAMLPPPPQLYHRRRGITATAAATLLLMTPRCLCVDKLATAYVLPLQSTPPCYCRCHAIATAALSPPPFCHDAVAAMPLQLPRHRCRHAAAAMLPPPPLPCCCHHRCRHANAVAAATLLAALPISCSRPLLLLQMRSAIGGEGVHRWASKRAMMRAASYDATAIERPHPCAL